MEEEKLPSQPPAPPTGVPEAHSNMAQKTIAIVGGIPPKPPIIKGEIIPEKDLKAEIALNIERRKARGHQKMRFHKFGGGTKHGTKPNLDPLVPGGAIARKMDHAQHEQAKLLSIGIDCRKTTPSVAERRRIRQKEGKK